MFLKVVRVKGKKRGGGRVPFSFIWEWIQREEGKGKKNSSGEKKVILNGKRKDGAEVKRWGERTEKGHWEKMKLEWRKKQKRGVTRRNLTRERRKGSKDITY